MPNMKITDKGNKYLSTLLQKNDNHILINEEFRPIKEKLKQK